MFAQQVGGRGKGKDAKLVKPVDVDFSVATNKKTEPKSLEGGPEFGAMGKRGKPLLLLLDPLYVQHKRS